MATAPGVVHAEGLAAGELRFQRCRDCESAVFYPRVLCPGCGGERLDWQTSGGRGTVYATTVVYARGRNPYNVALVDLDEGFRMMTRVEGLPPGQVAIGARVRLSVVKQDGTPLAVFNPAEEAAI